MFPSRRATLGGDVFRDEFSVSFDGTDEFIELAGDFNHTNHAIVCWVQVNASSNNRFIFDYRDGDNDGIILNVNISGRISYQLNTSDVSYNVVLSTGVWHHIVATNDGSNNKIYLNGVEVGSSDSSGQTVDVSSSIAARIGARSHTSAIYNFNGSMSELTFYNKGLSASEVKTIYNGREPYNHKEGVCSSNLVAWYRMGDGALDRFGITGDTNYQNGVITDVINAKLGNDLVTNGDFSNWTGDNPDNWTVNNETSDNTISQLGNAVRMVFTTGDLLEITQSILTVDKIYKVTIDCTAFDSGSGFRVQSGNDSANRPVNIKSTSGLGTFVGYFKASHSNLRIIRNGATDVTFTNVTCREVLGNTGIVRNMTPTNIIGNTP